MVKQYRICYVLILVLFCCKKPFNPTVISSAKSYLVVEGVINSGSDSTTIKLSKTVNLNGQTTVNPVIGATVVVEGDKSGSFQLLDVNGNGNYSTAGLNLPATQNYRLKIEAGSSQYVSDFMPVKQTPPIDSINYVIKDGVLNLYTNAHDPLNATHYYRWSYNETWIFHSKYRSYFVVDPLTNTMVPRSDAQQIYYCFANHASSNILLTNTSKLSSDVVYESPLTAIPITSERLEVKYSILVTQYALTGEAYNFYQNIKKNTEDLGSIFDAEPTQISGNIHNAVDASEPVIGYITVTNVQSKRIFISNSALPPNTMPVYPYTCEQDTALLNNKENYNEVQNTLINPPPSYLPTQGLFAPGGGIYGYLYSSANCVDCTIRGTTQTPSFWQ
jgi:hypothetical protein